MQRDVKVGLVLGVLLVAVVAVVFFRRDDEDRDKLAKLMPAPDEVADRAREMLGPSPTDPYPVAPEYLADSWQSPKPPKSVRTPTPQRNKPADSAAPPDESSPNGVENKGDDARSSAVLLPPEFGSARSTPRPRSETGTIFGRPASSSTAKHSSGAGEYVIQPGDTLSQIASRFLGSAAAWNQIYEANRDELPDPENIPAGQTIRIPGAAKVDRPVAKSSASPPRVAAATKEHDARSEPYVVQPGDTLISIARQHYRSGSRYLDILNANQDQLQDPRDLREGMVIRLPREQAEW
jgi:nucleoid-associated protein YgaU